MTIANRAMDSRDDATLKRLFPRLGLWLSGALVLSLFYLTCPVVLFNPFVFDAYSRLTVPWALRSDACAICQWVWGWRSGDLNDSLSVGRLDAIEVAHYADVRRVVAKLKLIAAGDTVIVMAILATGRRERRSAILARALVLALGCGLAGACAMLASWHEVFRMMHRVVFPGGGWLFPHYSYSLLLFPPDFWAAMTICSFVAPPVLCSVVAVSVRGRIRRALAQG